MKALLTALLITLSTAANADILIMKNKDGGHIVLTARVCPKEPDLFAGYAYGKGGLTLPFCWAFFDDLIHAVYYNGDRYTYNPNAFTLHKTDSGKGGGV